MSSLHPRAIALAIVSLAVLCVSGQNASPPTTTTPVAKGRDLPAQDALQTLNEASRAAYRRAREEALAHCGPVVLLKGDELVLAYGLYRSTAHVTPDVYHTLKSISHIPLALHALLDGQAGQPLSEQRLYDLKQYRGLVAAAARQLDTRNLSVEQRKQSKQITEESLAFLARILVARKVTDRELTEYRQQMRPLLEENSAAAARAQIDALHQQMQAWKSRLTDAEWGQMHVIVMGTQLPRQGNLAVQYFARLLGETGEGKRIVYAEAIFEEARALDLLGTRLVDTRIGTAFFQDSTYMYRDLLSEAARHYLDKLFPQANP